ncbi:MAG: protein kinase [Candidatus Berkiellales bacterium]
MMKAGPHTTNNEYTRFFEKIKNRSDELEKADIHSSLEPLLRKGSLLKIYQYLLDHQQEIIKQLMETAPPLAPLRAVRIEKSSQTTSRTVNIIEDINGEFVLILETKSKTKDDTKTKNLFQSLGRSATAKSGKSCWRIDLPLPEKWMNLKTEAPHEYIESRVEEAKLSQRFCKDAKSEIPDIPFPIHYSLLGQPFKDGSGWNISMYSPQAPYGNFEACGISRLWLEFSQYEIGRMTRGLFYGIQIMHHQKWVHQDLSADNVLIFKDNLGYYLKICDFGNSKPWFSKPAAANYGYESPEILSAYRSGGPATKFYHGDMRPTYGKYIDKILVAHHPQTRDEFCEEYQHCHPANDMWAAGILAFQLLKSTAIVDQPDEIFSGLEKINEPLLRSVLNPDREKRFTIEQVMAMLTGPTEATTKGPSPDVDDLTKSFGDLQISSPSLATEPPKMFLPQFTRDTAKNVQPHQILNDSTMAIPGSGCWK